jgi:nicotinate (nicotinamide) nucleotide adenylyltransferase
VSCTSQMWASRLRRAAPVAGAAAAVSGLVAYARAECHTDSFALAVNPYANGQSVQTKSSERLLQATPRKRIAIYGGSFNPITNAHLNCAAELKHSKLVDEVWITPCGRRPDKPTLRTSMIHRLVMCHLAVDTTFGSHFGVKVCDEEADKPRAMPSIVLMRKLAAKYPEADFYFACGADQITEVRSWTAPAEAGYWEEVEEAGEAFFRETGFLLIERPGSELDEAVMPPNVHVVSEALKARGSKMIETELSSTEVRNRVRPPDDIVRHGLRKVEPGGRHAWYDEAEGLVPPSVMSHIVRYGLYSRDDF